ncbi:MAG: ribonuclease III [Clostridia bacterium]|nr:ribonuclease III [Clostridia bacterium]
MTDLSKLEKTLGYRFQNRQYLITALTHPSMGGEHNQRMEFLGDAVLEMCVSEKIYEMHPEMKEGAMTRLRQKLVREGRLAEVAKGMQLGEYLLMDRGCAAGGGRENPSVLCDAFEAVLAAVYLDGGMEKARQMVMRFIGDCTEKDEMDAKSALQEYLQGRKKPLPDYLVIGEEGLPHERVFTVSVQLEGREIASGSGTSKKRAEQNAAMAALQKIKGLGEKA